jgi:hypothetical protein
MRTLRKILLGFITLVLCLGLLGTACVTHTEVRTQTMRVNTDPTGALVWKRDKNGKKLLGRAPLTVSHAYEVKTEKPSNWWWVLVGASAVTGSVGAVYYQSDSAAGKVLAYSGYASLIGSLAAYYILSYWKQEIPTQPEPIVLGATLDGYKDQKVEVLIPGPDDRAQLVLLPDPDRPAPREPAPVLATSSAPPPVPTMGGGGVVLAVFDIQDASRKIKAGGLDQLTEYLVARLTQVTRYRVVPREQLRARLVGEKKGSHRACFDESCQIEMGKALAAEKSLATKILRVGKRCAITSTLYDLKTETAETSALSRTDCSEDGLMDAMDRIARQLSGSDYR